MEKLPVPSEDVSLQRATQLSRSRLMPEHFHKDPANTQYAMEIGRSLGIDPVSAFQHIHVFKDKKGRLKSGLSAHLMVALARAAGHEVHVEGNPGRATAILIRGDATAEKLKRFQRMREEERRQKLSLIEDAERLYRMRRQQILDRIADLKDLAELDEKPSGDEVQKLRDQLGSLHQEFDLEELRQGLTETKFDLAKLVRFECTWTIARAMEIGLTSKDNWTLYRPEMLKRAACRGVVRDGAVEVLIGIRKVLGDMGIEYSDNPETEVSVSTAFYSPEEMGVEVDEEGRPMKPVDVIQDRGERLAEAAANLVSSTNAAGIAEWVRQMSLDASVSEEKRVERLEAVYEECKRQGILDHEVPQGEETSDLKTVLLGYGS